MIFRRLPPGLAAVALLVALQTAQAAPLAQVRRDFEHGRFADVLASAEQALPGAAAAQRPELHQLAALAAFNLGEHERSDSHFRGLLWLEPEHALDPYSVPPPALQRFEQLRRQLGPELLTRRREAQALQEAQLALEQERARVAALEQRVSLAGSASAAERERTASDLRLASLVRPVVTWLPFGAGQFHQGRRTAGTLLAVSQGTLALASVTSFFTYHSLLNRRHIQVQGEDGPEVVLERGIQPAFQERMSAWRTVNLVSTAGFFGLWLAGAFEASLRAPASASPAPGPFLTPALSVTTQGASAGLGGRF